MEGLGPVLFHTPSTGFSLRADHPYGPLSMAEHGSVSEADDSPDVPVTRFVGQPIHSIRGGRRPGTGVYASALPLLRSTGIHSWESVSAPISTGCVRRSSGPGRLAYGFEGNHCVNTSRHSSWRAFG